MSVLERNFQASLVREIKERLPGCIVMKNDSGHIQGIPDLTILHGPRWGALECKRSANAPARPNQKHYVETMDEMSFARFIYPENREEVLDALQRSLEA